MLIRHLWRPIRLYCILDFGILYLDYWRCIYSQKKQPDTPRPYKAFGYPLIPAIYLIFAAGLCINLLIYKPIPSWAGVGIVALGIPVFYIWKKMEKKTEE
jgi:hypothetical protein